MIWINTERASLLRHNSSRKNGFVPVKDDEAILIEYRWIQINKCYIWCQSAYSYVKEYARLKA